jgi:hypothetical protein
MLIFVNASEPKLKNTDRNGMTSGSLQAQAQ